nr:hypothetical protein [Tanacetum cinerariifolium]
MSEEFEASKPSGTKTISSYSSVSSDSTAPLSPEYPLTHASPTRTPTRVSFHRSTAHMAILLRDTIAIIISDPSSKKEGLDDEGQGLDDEGQGLEDEGPGIEEEEEAIPEGQQQAVLLVDTNASDPLGKSFRFVPEHGGAERISAFRQPTLVTWVNPKDCRVYTDILTYAPPVAPVQTLLSPKWSLGSLSVSPSSLGVSSPIALPVATPVATISRENHDLRRQISKERRERLELTNHVARIKRRHDYERK